MTFSSTWTLLFATVASLCSTAMAQLCTPEYGYWGYAYVVNTQSEVDAIAQSCTTINGSLVMYANYTGGFYLPNIRNILGSLQWRSLLRDTYSPDQPSPTTVDVPDLELVQNSLQMGSLPALRNFSAPKLKSVGWEVSVDYAVNVDLRALKEAEYFKYMGNASTLRLDSLREVRQRAFICNKDNCTENLTPDRAYNLSLPSLSVVGAIELDGRYSGVALPQLSNVSGHDFANRGFRFGTSGGEVLNLTFPKLNYVSGGMYLNGGIGSLAMDSMRNLTTDLDITTSALLNVTLPFEEARYIRLEGNITGAQFPNLRSWDTLIIDSREKLDCDTTMNSLANTTAHTYTCRYTVQDSDSGLSTGAKAGIGVGASVGGLLILGALAWCIARRKKRTERLKSESNIHLDETPPTYGEVRARDHPPEYVSTRERD